MEKTDCNHYEENEIKWVCCHLEADRDGDYCKWFTGIGINYRLICLDCYKEDEMNVPLISVCHKCFRDLEHRGSWENQIDGIRGNPEIKYKNSSLRFEHTLVQLNSLVDSDIISIKPSPNNSLYYIALANHEMYKIDLINLQCIKLSDIPNFKEPISKEVIFDIDPKEKWAVLSNEKGRYGVVWNINTGHKTCYLDRGDYCIEVSIFSIAFVTFENRSFLIHATHWNRLDITDLETGKIITERELPSFNVDEKQSKYLDYFHCSLKVSPDFSYLADNGWVWHPWGFVTSWNIKNWMTNPWESEDGPSKYELLNRSYFWDGPLCWVDNKYVAIWGYGNDDDNLIPAVCIVNVESGIMERWFPGPEGDLYYDEYLFACSKKHGTSIWDVESGEQLHIEDGLKPTVYHSIDRSFVTILPDKRFKITRLVS